MCFSRYNKFANMKHSKIKYSRNTTHTVEPPMCPRKTICRHERNNMYKLSNFPVAFSACSCQEYSVKAHNIGVQSVPKVKRSLTHSALFYSIIVCYLLNVVIATTNAQEGPDFSERSGKTIDNIPNRAKGIWKNIMCYIFCLTY